MELQAELGDRAGALSTYHRCASVLERELGVEPDAATRAVARPAARGRPSRRRRRDEAAPEPARAAGPRWSAAVAEFGALQAAWRAAAAGRPRRGPGARRAPGVGKSRLVAELADGGPPRRAPWSRRAQCFGDLRPARAGAGRRLAAQLRRCRRRTARLDPVWRVEVERLVPAERSATPPTPGTRAWSTPGSGTASSKGWPGRCSRSVARCCWCSTTCSGATRRPWPSSPSAWACGRDAPAAGGGDAARRRADRRPRARRLDRPPAGERGADRPRARPLDRADTAPLGRGDVGGPLAGRRRATCCTRSPAASRCTSSRPCAARRPAAARCPAGDLAAVLRHRLAQADAGRAGGGRARRGGRPGLHRSTCSPRPSDLDADAVVRGRRRAVAPPDPARARRRATTSPTTCCATPPTTRSARRGAGCCTGASRRDSSCCTPTIPTRSSAQLAEQYARGGRPDRAVALLPPRRRGRGRRFAHAEAIRLHRRGAGDRARPAAGPGPRRAQELAILRGDGGAAERAVRLRLARAAGRRWSARSRWPSALGRARVAGRRAGRAVGVAVRPGPDRRRAQIGARALALVAAGRRDLSGAGALRVRRRRRVSLGRPAEALEHFAARRRSSGGGIAERRHPPRRARPGLGGARPLALGDDDAAGRPRARRSRWPGRSTHPYSLAVALGLRRASPTRCAATGGACDDGRRAERAVRAVRLRLLPRVGAWCSTAGRRGGAAGHRPGPARDRRTSPPTAALARHAVLAVRCWPTCSARDGRPRRARAPRWTRRARRRAPATTCGGCPRYCGCGPPATRGRAPWRGCGRPPRWRRTSGSLALGRHAAGATSGRARRAGVRRRPDAGHAGRTLRERRVPSVRRAPTGGARRGGDHHD